jgi:hypothetical protein
MTTPLPVTKGPQAKSLHKKVVVSNANKAIAAAAKNNRPKKEKKTFSNVSDDLKLLAFFADETFTSTLTKSNEIEFTSPNSYHPIKIGYVSDGSALQGSMLAVYLKHRPAWRLLERNGLVYIVKRLGNEEDNNPSATLYRAYERERYTIILVDVDTFIKMYSSPSAHANIIKNKTNSLVKQWNSLNSKNSSMGQRAHVAFNFCVEKMDWNEHPIQHRSAFHINLSTWAKTKKSNWESNASCSPSDVSVS